MARERELDEGRMLLNSPLLRAVIERIRARAMEDMLKPAPSGVTTETWLRDKRDFANAIGAVLPAIESMVHEIQGEEANAEVTDTA